MRPESRAVAAGVTCHSRLLNTGALMAANVLKSNQAVDASVQVVRAFVKMRNMLASNAELAKKIESLEKKYDHQFKAVFNAIKQLMLPPAKPKGKIGFVKTRKRK
jgi:hypothetical protein